MPYFEDLELGDQVGPVGIVATDESVANFCDVWSPPTPNRFTDTQTALDSGMAGPIVPGIMAMAMMAQLLTDWLALIPSRISTWFFGSQYLTIRRCFLRATITDLRQEDGQNMAECDILMLGSQGERHVGGGQSFPFLAESSIRLRNPCFYSISPTGPRLSTSHVASLAPS